MARNRATSSNPGVNQRASTASAIASSPCSRTVAARSCHASGSPKRAAVQQSTSFSMRSGASSASRMPTAPPSDRPTNEKVSSPALVEDARGEIADRLHVGHRRAAVSRMLDRHDAASVERRQLRVPHRRRGAERPAEDDGAAHPR